jgi:hypothetical protein
MIIAKGEYNMSKEQEDDKQIQETESLCFVFEESIILKKEKTGYFYYDIPLTQCKTSLSIVDWVQHLLRKNWVTKEIIESFISLVRFHNNIKY